MRRRRSAAYKALIQHVVEMSRRVASLQHNPVKPGVTQVAPRVLPTVEGWKHFFRLPNQLQPFIHLTRTDSEGEPLELLPPLLRHKPVLQRLTFFIRRGAPGGNAQKEQELEVQVLDVPMFLLD